MIPPALFEGIADASSRLLDADLVSCWRLDGDEIVLAGSWGADPELIAVPRLGVRSGLPGAVAAAGEPVIVADMANDPRLPSAHRELAHQLGHRALMIVPVKLGDRVIGVLALRTKRRQGFTPDDFSIANGLAAHLAAALENGRLLDESAQRREAAELLAEVGRVVSQALDPIEVAELIAEHVRGLLAVTNSAVFRLRPETGELVSLALRGDHGPGARPIVFPPGRGTVGLAVRDRAPIVTSNLVADRRIPLPPDQRARMVAAPFGAVLALPLISRGQVIGALALGDRVGRVFTDADVRFAQAFADQAAVAFENARLYRRAEERGEKLAALAKLTQVMTSATDRDSVFDAIAVATSTLLDAALTSVWVHDSETDVLRLLRHSGHRDRGEAILEVTAIAPGRGLVGPVFASRTPQYVRDLEQDGRSANRRLVEVGLRGWAGMPMMTTRGVVGVLSIGFTDEREFSDEEKELMRLLADHAAIAIQTQRAAESLRSAHAETEGLLASISGILVAVDELGTVTRWNATAEATFGIPADRVAGRPFADAPIDWDWPAILARIGAVRSQKQPTRLDEIRYRRPDGREGVLGLTVNPIAGGHGYLLIGAEMTERKQLEQQLVQAQKMESIGQLAAGVAHEINTPIQFVGDNTRFLQSTFQTLEALIRGYWRLRDAASAGVVAPALLDEVVRAEQSADLEYLVEEVPTAFNQTLDGIGRVATIVRALKDFAHPDSGERVPTDLNRAVRSALTVARNEIKYVADVDLELGELPPVVCQPGELNQALLNLIVNAAQAIAARVADTPERGHIGVTTSREGDEIVIAISDTGGGIPEAVRDRIFDPFFTTKPVGKGTGQGLAIARSVVVDKHHGSLTFTTAAGRGTTFFIRLPIDSTSTLMTAPA